MTGKARESCNALLQESGNILAGIPARPRIHLRQCDQAFFNSKSDDSLKLSEKYNGLGYQNLISMVFDLMRFRDDWMREGKAKQAKQDSDRAIEPLHLVLVEEPEAHLHVQVQQVFIRKAYDVLTNHKFIKENENFATQLVISTHSSHVARETNFADLHLN